jgi:hypothetical protein
MQHEYYLIACSWRYRGNGCGYFTRRKRQEEELLQCAPLKNATTFPIFPQIALWDNNEGLENIFHFIFSLSHAVFFL